MMSEKDVKELVVPGRRFTINGLTFEIVTVEKRTAFIMEMKTKHTFTYGVDTLIRLQGVTWEKEIKQKG